MLWLRQPSSWWVLSRLCCAPAQILQRMPRNWLWQGDRRPARPVLSTIYLLEEELVWWGLIHVSHMIASCPLQTPHPYLIRAVQAMKYIYFYVLWCINAHYYINVPWMALPTRHAVSFSWACVMSVPRAESRSLTFDPGPFTFGLFEVWAALPLQLIRLPNIIILDSQCTIEWIFSLQKYRSTAAAALQIHPRDFTVRMSLNLQAAPESVIVTRNLIILLCIGCLLLLIVDNGHSNNSS